MTRKTLIFGCSLTLGSYVPHDGYERLDSNVGWYNHVQQLKNKHVDVYAIGGGGYTDWAQIMHAMKAAGSLYQYDTVIIAETTAPRFSLWLPDFKHEKLVASNNNDHDVHVTCHRAYIPHITSITSNPWQYQAILDNYGTLSNFDIDRYTLDVCGSPSLNFYEEAAVLYMRTLLIELGSKAYVFSFFEPQIEPHGDLIMRLDHDLFAKLLKSDTAHNLTNNGNFPGGPMSHQTLAGNRAIGSYLSELIEQARH